MAQDRKISQLNLVGTPARTNTLTALDQLGANVRGLVASWLGLTLDTDLTFSDNVTGDASATAHGYLPKLPNDATKFLNGVGGYAVPGTVSVGSPAGDQRTSNGDFATTYIILGGTVHAGDLIDVYIVGTEHVTGGSLVQYAVKLNSVTVLPAQGFSAAVTDGTFTGRGELIVLVTGASGKVGGTWGLGQSNGVTAADTTALARNPWVRPITAEVSIDWTVNQAVTVTVSGLAANATSTLTRLVIRRP